MTMRTRAGAMGRHHGWIRAALLCSALSLPAPAFAQQAKPAPAADPLLDGFRSPPQEAKPRTWWHWINGNVTESGIVKDLEWMQRVGIGGAQYFEAGGALASDNFIRPRLIFGDPNWQRAMKLATSTADRLGLEFTASTSTGWSHTGGTWVTPKQAAKKYVWSETILRGGKPFAGKLAQPPSQTGAFQTVSLPGAPTYYADAMVVAYRLPDGEQPDLRPVRIAQGTSTLDIAALMDGDYGARQKVSVTDGDAVTVDIDFAKVETVRGLSLGLAGDPLSDSAPARIEVSDDGATWRPGATLTGPGNAVLKTYAFAPLTARHFRLILPKQPPKAALGGFGRPATPTKKIEFQLTELRFETAGMVNRFVEKAGFSAPAPYAPLATVATDADAVVRPQDVVDITRFMEADGTLRWTPPKGRWRVVRLGYSLTGEKNHPAPKETVGLEIDKFSPSATGEYVDTYLSRFEQAAGPELVGRRGLTNLISDSWEAGVQNWTDDMPAEFKRLRGYDLAPWVPVLTGHVVGSAADSDRFLWDWRRTLQDLLARHYSLLHEALNKRGMGLYAEAQGDDWRALADGLEIKARADVPMAEIWFEAHTAGPGQPALKADMKEAASAAHLTGRRFVANESLTVIGAFHPFSYSPAMLKPAIDEIFAYGVNRFVLHTSTHQPEDKGPGMTLGPIGQYITRNESWAEQSKALFGYIARASYLLQQGQYVADVAYYYGEEEPTVALFNGQNDAANDRLKIEVPPGTGYDFINAETLRTTASVAGGRLAVPGGMTYRLLYIRPDATAMTQGTLDRIAALVDQGLVVVGPKPQRRLGREGDDATFAATATRLWGEGTDKAVRSVGAGRVLPTATLDAALAAEGIAPDVSFSTGGAAMLQLHRSLPGGAQVYYLVNRNQTDVQTVASFRTAGLAPELWDADTGRTTTLSYRVVNGRTEVPLTLAKHDSAFIVFRAPGAGERSVAAPRTTPQAPIAGPWTVAFQPGRGAPASITLPQLASLSASEVDGVRYFSGTATYRKTITVPAGWLGKGRRLILDLGDVREIAEVRVNGRAKGIAWKPPYRLDVTDAVHAGRNSLEIAVTNLWPNRLAGDAHLPPEQRIGWTNPSQSGGMLGGGMAGRKDVLAPAGLIGPVRLAIEE